MNHPFIGGDMLCVSETQAPVLPPLPALSMSKLHPESLQSNQPRFMAPQRQKCLLCDASFNNAQVRVNLYTASPRILSTDGEGARVRAPRVPSYPTTHHSAS